jgi:hypothetical protein
VNKEELKMKAIAQACDNATDYKKIYEEKFGLKLSPKRFSEQNVYENAPQQGERYFNNYAGKRASDQTVVSGLSAAAPPDVQEGTSSFGELIYKARITVEYSTESK